MKGEFVPTGSDWKRSWRQKGTRGQFPFGRSTVMWTRSIGASSRDRNSTFVAELDGSMATVVINAVQMPFTSRVRKGLPIRVGGRLCELKRNGPRPLRRMRTIELRCEGDPLFTARYSHGEAQVWNNAGLRWTSREGGLIAADASVDEVAVIVAMVAIEVHMAIRLLNVLQGL